MHTDEMIERLRAGERRALARAITLVESTRADHRQQAQKLLDGVMADTGRAIRLGLSGAPGVGKSTFIEALGTHVTGLGHKVAVLAVDPSSARSGGSILGDKTRMEELSRDPNAFIRPSPAGTTLGGVARRTREAMLLVEAAGFDVVLIETVGVGQSETAVADMVDMFVLLQSPGGGDDLQGIKRGIMELADLIVVNKADGALEQPAKLARSQLVSALHLMRPRSPNWKPHVLLTSALSNKGIDEVWDAVTNYQSIMLDTGELTANRAEQARAWMWNEIREGLIEAFKAEPDVAARVRKLEADVAEGRMTPGAAADMLLKRFQHGAE
ncbi:methylmalonyl Co-A mutase-associated GTPase MeaB [Iodidimonas sp. SYSU 1G8]|uniref:methylmalonyl Co-A mutase-associated GTPase MeaB n=1 Tax=Iodidimonas sp. SYSU 1G8 TaxID=3133967 RepID=UPI0031FF1955